LPGFNPSPQELAKIFRRFPSDLGSVAMPNGTYYRRQAEVCLALARACERSGIAKRLLALAADFQAKAANFKDDAFAAKPRSFPTIPICNPQRVGPINQASSAAA
jgi:hypothetical protein